VLVKKQNAILQGGHNPFISGGHAMLSFSAAAEPSVTAGIQDDLTPRGQARRRHFGIGRWRWQ
jgi:hypothetical protein